MGNVSPSFTRHESINHSRKTARISQASAGASQAVAGGLPEKAANVLKTAGIVLNFTASSLLTAAEELERRERARIAAEGRPEAAHELVERVEGPAAEQTTEANDTGESTS